MISLVNDCGKTISIKNIIIIVFVLAMLISISSIGFMIFANWFSSAQATTTSIAESINNAIYKQIESFMQVPTHINEVNHKIIANGLLDLSDEKLREKFFVEVLTTHSDEIYGFCYATAQGEYFGACRNEKGILQIKRTDASTGGDLWYYSVNEDMTADELVVQAGPFDPRIRPWYKAAEAAKSPTLSPVYKHPVVDDSVISAVWPIYDENGELHGVMATHMLLSGIQNYLETVVRDYLGYAIIVEKNTGALIANSMGLENFTVLQDGTLKLHNISESGNSSIQRAYQYYNANHNPQFHHKSNTENLYFHFQEIHMKGFDWVIMSAIPSNLLMSNAVQSIYWTIILVLLALVLSIMIFNNVTGRLFRPINNLLQVAESLSSGDLSKRIKVYRNDEIGIISESLNRVADKMEYLVNNLEANVKERTEELYKAYEKLEENKNDLQLILNSTAEAIFGIHLNGDCSFCNQSCIRLLGYNSQEELLGKNMHDLIHHSHRDGTPFPRAECRIIQSIQQGKGLESDTEVFWRADGTSFDVEYRSYPQIKNGQVVGAVITFTDITGRKEREEKIHYLSYHDTLTGLYNRRSFEESLIKIDIPENLPLSVIFGDINGLKMTNDIFGHTMGDELIKKSAEILKNACRKNDIVARIGGDEFVILLPKTNQENAERILERIKAEFSTAQVAAIKCSMSLGIATKTSVNQSLAEVITKAENEMYKDKAMNRKSVNKDMINTIIETLHARNPEEKRHSIAVSELAGELGSVLHLPELEINRLKKVGYLHDIGKITCEENVLAQEALTEEERDKMRQHPVVGYRILNLFDDTLDLAEYVYSHHERWDGSGYPRGLEGEQIPLLSRIISVVETYERIINKGTLPLEERKNMALETIKEGAGTRFDPKIVVWFVQMMDEGSNRV